MARSCANALAWWRALRTRASIMTPVRMHEHSCERLCPKIAGWLALAQARNHNDTCFCACMLGR
eukprot:358610-Chlamydomonas_euryale.AAC.2